MLFWFLAGLAVCKPQFHLIQVQHFCFVLFQYGETTWKKYKLSCDVSVGSVNKWTSALFSRALVQCSSRSFLCGHSLVAGVWVARLTEACWVLCGCVSEPKRLRSSELPFWSKVGKYWLALWVFLIIVKYNQAVFLQRSGVVWVCGHTWGRREVIT